MPETAVRGAVGVSDIFEELEMEKTHYNADDIKRVVRFEDLGSDIWNPAEDEFFVDGYYEMTLDDMRTAVKNMSAQGVDSSMYLKWADMLYDMFEDSLGPDDIVHFYYDRENYFDMAQDEKGTLDAVWNLFYEMERDCSEMEAKGRTIPLCVEEAGEYIECFDRNRGLPRSEWKLPAFVKSGYIEHFNWADELERASAEEKKLFRQYVDELAPEGDLDALRARAYGRYYGEESFEQDIEGARADFEKLFELTESWEYAGILGDIYYSGICGAPDYDRALKYFVFGAAHGDHGSIIKIADMYMYGKGVIQSEDTARLIIEKIYGDLEKAYDGHGGGEEFADAAYRLGSIELNSRSGSPDVNEALNYLLPARMAVRKRMWEHGSYDESDVARDIDECIKKADELMPPEPNTGAVEVYDAWPVRELLSRGYELTWDAVPVDEGKWEVTFRRSEKGGEHVPRRVFLTVPEIRWCDFADTVRVRVVPTDGLIKRQGKTDRLKISYSSEGTLLMLKYKKENVMKLDGSMVELLLPENDFEPDQVLRMAAVEFQSEGRMYDYICPDEDIEEGDTVAVEGYAGVREVKVKKIFNAKAADLPLPLYRYKEVIKKIQEEAE